MVNGLGGNISFPSRVTLVESDVRNKRQEKLNVFLSEAYKMCVGNDECLSIMYAFFGVSTSGIGCTVLGYQEAPGMCV